MLFKTKEEKIRIYGSLNRVWETKFRETNQLPAVLLTKTVLL